MKTAEDIVNDKQREIVCVDWDQTVRQTCRKMIETKIGAIVVKKDNEFVGIWSERDLLRNICNEGFDPKTARIFDYMTSPLHSTPHSTRIHKLEEMFLGLFLRHLLIEKDGKFIGMLSIGDVLRASLIEKNRQFEELHEFVSWDYYENWRLGRSKKR
jgi:signal-transduction protein with cAMP-binding, CBS, and nucleotidyltransferase domain